MRQMTFEYALENNRLRDLVREHLEVKPLRSAYDTGSIAHALHIACGRGSATESLMKYFSPARVSAIDRDEWMIAIARDRYSGYPIDFSVGDVRSLGFEDKSFDAAFNLADLHNFEDWERAVLELRRVLKPGGLLVMEDLSRESFAHSAGRIFKRLTEHPYDSMLTMGGFREFVIRSGFEVLRFEERNPFGLLKYFILVARKA